MIYIFFISSPSTYPGVNIKHVIKAWLKSFYFLIWAWLMLMVAFFCIFLHSSWSFSIFAIDLNFFFNFYNTFNFFYNRWNVWFVSERSEKKVKFPVWWAVQHLYFIMQSYNRWNSYICNLNKYQYILAILFSSI